jgi:hypothetical protein
MRRKAISNFVRSEARNLGPIEFSLTDAASRVARDVAAANGR